jgi:hypothetical protein
MPPTITARERVSLLAAALSKVDDADLRAALDGLGARPGLPRAVINAGNALRRGRGVASAIGLPPYRALLPYLAVAVAEACLARTVEVLGDHSDDPSREQLIEGLATVRESFSDATIGVMLASVAADDMPASDLSFEIATTDERFGLTDWQPAPERGERAEAAGEHVKAGDGDVTGEGAPAEARRVPDEQRAARRERRKAAAEDRRRRKEAADRTAARVRSVRKQDRAASSAPAVPAPSPSNRRAAPTLVRLPILTPGQRQDFDPSHPLVGAVVFAWVPFGPDAMEQDGGGGDGAPVGTGHGGPGWEAGGPEPDLGGPDGEPTGGGKRRPCVVIGVSADELLVRPGYSGAGRASRDWTSVPVRDWPQAGLDQPTWIGAETVRVPRPETTPSVKRLSIADWNALW